MISAIIVNYNGGTMLSACVASLLTSSHPVRIIVSDNGSTDDSIDRLLAFFREDERLFIIRNNANIGFSAGSNAALSFAIGDYLLFINPDCMVGPDTLAHMHAAMEAHPEAGMGGCLIRNVDGSEQDGCRRYTPTPWRSLARVLKLNQLFLRNPKFQTFNMSNEPLPTRPITVEAISGAFMFVRRSALEKVGPLDDGYFLHCEDLDWCMRFGLAGYPILFVPDIEVTHLKGVCSTSRPVFVEWHKHRGMVRFYKKFFRHQYARPLMWLVITSVWLRFCLKSAHLFFKKLGGGNKGSKGNDLNTSNQRCIALLKSVVPLDNQRTVIVSGARTAIGQFLIPRLIQSGYRIIALSRQTSPAHDTSAQSVFWLKADLEDAASIQTLPTADFFISLSPLWMLSPQTKTIAMLGVKRIVAFSSTSVISKAQSPSEYERDIAVRLATSENELAVQCERHSMYWTLFRPTLIYGLTTDQNVSLIKKIINTVGVFPLLGAASGLRQPVHADDLAQACVATLNRSNVANKTYNLSGGETLSYRSMVERIFVQLNRKPRFLQIPLGVFAAVIRVLSLMPKYKNFNAAMAQRMNKDLVFSHEEATRDLAYTPRQFSNGKSRST